MSFFSIAMEKKTVEPPILLLMISISLLSGSFRIFKFWSISKLPHPELTRLQLYMPNWLYMQNPKKLVCNTLIP